MIIKMQGEAFTAEEQEQIKRDAQFCALCNGPSSDVDGAVVLIKRSAEFPYNLVTMLGSCCLARYLGEEHDQVVAALRAKARVRPEELNG